MSKNWQFDVRQSMSEVYDQPVRYVPTIDVDEKEILLRQELIKEEVKETLDGLESGDLVAVADGIVDSIVVLLGTACTLGIDVQPLWDEVHRTNMAKLGGPMREDGKRLKPKGWVGPDIERFLEKQKP